MEREFKDRLENAIEELKEAYEEAQELTFVRDPLAYALYHTWKKYDRMDKDNKRGGE